MEILSNMPMLESYHRFVQENLFDKRLKQIKSKSSDPSIPVISLDALPPGTDMSTTYPEPEPMFGVHTRSILDYLERAEAIVPSISQNNIGAVGLCVLQTTLWQK
ncbi:MAG: hypothetical protein IH948_04370 [Bacteroidetes bacterium]|nr:hypothetical protein [Bacteroidota bacterium]